MAKQIQDSLEFIKRNYKSYPGLLVTLLLVLAVVSYTSSLLGLPVLSQWPLLGLCMSAIIVSSHWSCAYFKLPKRRKNRVGLAIAVSVENEKQRQRLEKDVVKRVTNHFQSTSIGHKVDIILIEEHKVRGIIKSLLEFKEWDIARKSGTPATDDDPAKRWYKIAKRLDCHMYIWGSISEREQGVETTIQEYESLVVHSPVDLKLSSILSQDMTSLLHPPITFPSHLELEGFITTAQQILMFIKYTLGVAAYFSYDYKLAFQLWESLSNDLLAMNDNTSEDVHKKLQAKLPELLADACLNIAGNNVQRDNLSEAKKWLEVSKKYVPNHHGYYLTKSIISFWEGNLSESRQLLNVAQEETHGQDKTWLYNVSFLDMVEGSWQKAYKGYQKLGNSWFETEGETLRQVFGFLDKALRVNPSWVWVLFVKGLLLYKKYRNSPAAHVQMSIFLKKADTKQHGFLIERARSFVSSMEDEMNRETGKKFDKKN